LKGQDIQVVPAMLKPYQHELREIAFVFAHIGIREDGGNRAYAVAAAILDPEGPRRTYETLVRYPRLTVRERYYSNLSKEALETAPAPVLREIQSSFSYHCGNCGEEIPNDTIRCPRCGQAFRMRRHNGKRLQHLSE
jgi:DNA-directed RNA polymerase subunit RPC12/RpoP